MGFWKAIKLVNDHLFDCEAEAEYIDSDRYDIDTKIIKDHQELDSLITDIESTKSKSERDHLLDKFDSIQQQTGGSSYDLYRKNKAINIRVSLNLINRESNLIKKQSMKRLYKNGIYNFEDLY